MIWILKPSSTSTPKILESCLISASVIVLEGLGRTLEQSPTYDGRGPWASQYGDRISVYKYGVRSLSGNIFTGPGAADQATKLLDSLLEHRRNDPKARKAKLIESKLAPRVCLTVCTSIKR
jgi:hypothetical protein